MCHYKNIEIKGEKIDINECSIQQKQCFKPMGKEFLVNDV